MSLIFATQLAAVATAVLAVFAIVTAWYAHRAFLKQSQEVSAIERQVTDQQELTKQQAELLKVQSGQLELQRQQADEQRQANEKQAEVLGLQAKELRASLEARQQASLELRYQYASTVTAWLDEPYPAGAGWIASAHVVNTGERPVRDLSARWYAGSDQIRPEKQPFTACLLPGKQADFDCGRVDVGSIGKGLKAIVEFRPVGADWWKAGTDGSLVGGMEVGDTPLLSADGTEIAVR